MAWMDFRVTKASYNAASPWSNHTWRSLKFVPSPKYTVLTFIDIRR